MRGFHGLFDEEGISGNEFNVSIDVDFHSSNMENIHDTINYAEVFRIVKEAFSQRHKLLETLADTIIAAISEMHPEIKRIAISIAKLSAPIANYSGTVGIKAEKLF